MYLWLKPDFQQVCQVKNKNSNREVDILVLILNANVADQIIQVFS